MSQCPTCGLLPTPAKDVARLCADAAIALRNVQNLGLAGRQRHELRRAHLIIAGLATLFDDEAQRQGQE